MIKVMSKAWLDYINEYILLKGETLHQLDSEDNHDVIHLDVIKRTARTRRIVAKLTIGIKESEVPPETLISTFPTPNVKRQLNDKEKAYEWMRNGWVIREYRLKKDERTIDREQYRMGYPLFLFLQKLTTKMLEERNDSMRSWLNKWQKTKHPEQGLSLERLDILRRLNNVLSKLASDVILAIDHNLDHIESLNVGWRFKKQLTYLHFLLALYQISSDQKQFDWKEIGARYFQYIGGSKVFDSYKSDLIQEAEELLGRPLHLFGLTSLGTITPIYFAGEMKSPRANYHYGSIHATTDLAVFTDRFETTADVIWLVENRGVLTRMAYEIDFIKASKSFILAIDGQLRSSHRQLIQYLMKNVKQVIIWTDIDEAGLVIAKDAADLVRASNTKIKWVVPPLDVTTNQMEFEDKYQTAMKINREEQEQEMGGVEWWKKWIDD